MKLKDIEVKSFVTKETLAGGAPPQFTQFPCESADYCISDVLCPPNTEANTCVLACR